MINPPGRHENTSSYTDIVFQSIFVIIFGYFCDILKLYATYNFLTELGLYVSHVYLHVKLTDVSLITRNYLEFTCEPLEIAYFYIFCRIMPALCGHYAGIHAGIIWSKAPMSILKMQNGPISRQNVNYWHVSVNSKKYSTKSVKKFNFFKTSSQKTKTCARKFEVFKFSTFILRPTLAVLRV